MPAPGRACSTLAASARGRRAARRFSSSMRNHSSDERGTRCRTSLSFMSRPSDRTMRHPLP
eukprot:4887120-Prymnesium_polylepis.1